MINKMEYIETNEQSYPFVSAVERCGLEKAGYIEKEYFMYGTANVYETLENDEIGIRAKDAPYVNRLIVRAPKNLAKCSGNVVVEIINPTSGKDIERMWIVAYRHFVRNGDIYIGITSKPNTVEALKRFDEKRYAPLAWNNPTIDIPLPKVDERNYLGDYKQYYETGLFWDMLTDLAHAIRDKSEVNPVSEYSYKNIILTGWSQSACYMTRYLRTFAYRDEVKRNSQVFDGYLSGAAPRSFPVPLNQYELCRKTDTQETRVSYATQPYLVVQTESENADFDAYLTTKEDSDAESFLYRVYEFAGPSHDTWESSVAYYTDCEDLKRCGMTSTYPGLHNVPNDYPYHFLFASAYQHLYNWIDTGIAPPHIPRILTDSQGHNERDALGNSIGGVRTCLMDCPTAAYYYYSSVKPGDSFMDPKSEQFPLFGHEEPFPKQMLEFMYESLANYKAMAIKATKQHVTKGYVLKQDEKAIVEYAVALAKKRGLR